MSEPLILHEFSLSGNCYKVRLTASLVGAHLERREYDIMKGETRTPEFLANVNANGRIPVLQVGDRFIPESNAACYYVAEGSSLIPTERFDHADLLRWMFWEQYNHEPNIATARYWLRHGHLTPSREPLFAQKRLAGYAALGVMEGHLASRTFFVGERYSIADIALYAYTHVGDQGGFELKRYPAVCAWLDRVRAQPGHVPLLKPQS